MWSDNYGDDVRSDYGGVSATTGRTRGSAICTDDEDPTQSLLGGSEAKRRDKPYFSGQVGFILTCLGSAIGTGNIWRFPRIVALQGGKEGAFVFIIVWMLFWFIWASPLITAEFGMGRYTGTSVIEGIGKLLGPGAKWKGAWLVGVMVFIGSYYSVVVGWCIYYAFYFMANDLPTLRADESLCTAEQPFESFKIWQDFQDSWMVFGMHATSLFAVGVVVILGLRAIERLNFVAVPVIVILLIYSAAYSLSFEGASDGMKYLFHIEWSQFGKANLWFNALVQTAFDTNAGTGLYFSYGAYLHRDSHIVWPAVIVPVVNNIVSLLAAFVLFSVGFVVMGEEGCTTEQIVETLKDAGPASTGLTFIWMPVLFSGLLRGRVACVIFFVCLACAAISSLVAILETIVHVLCDAGLKRWKATLISLFVLFCIGTPSALRIEFLVNQDFVWGTALLFSGLLTTYIILKIGIRDFRLEIVNLEGVTTDMKLRKLWEVIMKYIVFPEAIIVIVWWLVAGIVNGVRDGEKWYLFTESASVATAVIQWALLHCTILFCHWLLRGKSDWICRNNKRQQESLAASRASLSPRPRRSRRASHVEDVIDDYFNSHV